MPTPTSATRHLAPRAKAAATPARSSGSRTPSSRSTALIIAQPAPLLLLVPFETALEGDRHLHFVADHVEHVVHAEVFALDREARLEAGLDAHDRLRAPDELRLDGQRLRHAVQRQIA